MIIINKRPTEEKISIRWLAYFSEGYLMILRKRVFGGRKMLAINPKTPFKFSTVKHGMETLCIGSVYLPIGEDDFITSTEGWTILGENLGNNFLTSEQETENNGCNGSSSTAIT
uniref:Uncharacterized protein n=1 Tax=Lepeophtheirus salmonis TaxID=72036 RepID=A0A0K2T749_LEPSM